MAAVKLEPRGVYVLKETKTGLYYGSDGYWTGPKNNRKWVARATEESEEDAVEMTGDEVSLDFPKGIPDGWEAIKLYDLGPVPKNRKRKE